MNDDSGQPKATKNVLLDELESIQNLLLDNLKPDLIDDVVKTESPDFDELDDELDTAIPILEDIVSETENNPDQNASSFLNLDDIFGSNTANTDPTIRVTEGIIEDPSRIADGARPDFARADASNREKKPVLIEAEEQPTGHSAEELADGKLASTQSQTAEKELEFLIQELVDEFIPVLEDKLRQRLSRCAPAIILELSKKLVKD